jgi:hypothetical protein
MPTYRIETEGTAHEIYYVDAPSEEKARSLFNDGHLTKPVVMEVEGAEIIEVAEVSEEDDE